MVWATRTASLHRRLIVLVVLQRAPALLLGLFVLFFFDPYAGDWWSVYPVLILYGAFAVGTGFAIPVWLEMFRRTLPEAVRGRVLGNRMLVGNLGAAALAGTFAWVSRDWGRPDDPLFYRTIYGTAFCLAGVLLMIGVIPLAKLRDSGHPPDWEPLSFRQFVARIHNAGWRDTRYRTLLIGLGLGCVFLVASSWLIDYGNNQFNPRDRTASAAVRAEVNRARDDFGQLGNILWLSVQAVGSVVVGWMCSRGLARAATLGTLTVGVGVLIAAPLIKDPTWYLAIVVGGNGLWTAGFSIAPLLFAMPLMNARNPAPYIGIWDPSKAPFIIGLMAVGRIVYTSDPVWLFGVSAVISVIAIGVVAMVRMPVREGSKVIPHTP
jgi:hypothetical protein